MDFAIKLVNSEKSLVKKSDTDTYKEIFFSKYLLFLITIVISFKNPFLLFLSKTFRGTSSVSRCQFYQHFTHEKSCEAFL